VDKRHAELERAFRKYGSNHGAIAIVPKDKAYDFVEQVTERQTDGVAGNAGQVSFESCSII
jgi:hypothetical protein